MCGSASEYVYVFVGVGEHVCEHVCVYMPVCSGAGRGDIGGGRGRLHVGAN